MSGPEDDEDDALSLLLVEDDEVDRLAFRRALSTAGLVAQVVEAPSLAAARDALVGGDFDCAVVDLGLPDGSGMELLGARRGDGRALPMVVLTGAGSESRGVEAIRNGAEDYVVKGEAAPAALARSIRFAIERGLLRPREAAPVPDGVSLRVRRRGASGVEAVISSPALSAPYRVRSANRSVLMYLLGRQLMRDRAGGLPPAEEGWCSDRDLAIGIWGRTDADTARNRLHVLVHRVRRKLSEVGLDEDLIETRRAAVRVAVASVDIDDD